MTAPFSRWTAELSAASTPESQRALLLEISRWRAAHLIDVPGQRDSAWALSKLHHALGDAASAESEARSLHSLCSTPPAASRAEVEAAESWLGQVTGKGKPQRTAASRAALGKPNASNKGRERSDRSDRSERGGRANPRDPDAAVAQAVELGHKGQYSQAFKVLKGATGPRPHTARMWLDLHRALSEPDKQEQRLNALLGRLERGLPRPSASQQRSSEPPAEPTTRVGALLGRDPKGRRDRVLARLHAFSREDPGSADAMAAATLLDHLDRSGPGTGAPWLVGLVMRALADDAPKTRAAIQTLTQAGSSAVPIYDEPTFGEHLALWRLARAHDMELDDLRRGVLKDEPADRRVWTQRLSRGGQQAMVAIAPEIQELPPEGASARVAQRIHQLGGRAVLVAPGDGHGPLREAATAVGLQVATDLNQAVALVDAQLPAATARPPRDASTAKAVPASPPVSSAKAERRAQLEAVRDVLCGDQVPSVDDLVPVLEPLRRVREVLDLADTLTGDDAEHRVVTLLAALHQVVSPEVRLLQATTLALRHVGDSGPEGPAAQALLSEPCAERFGGPGMEPLVAVAHALQSAGVQVDRVLRGPTRRERREDAALDTLAPHVEDLWRLLVTANGVRGEVWVVTELPPEGRGAVPLLVLRERPRVAVLPIQADLLAGWSDLGGPEPIGWTGDNAADVVAAVQSWPQAPESKG